MKTLKRLIKTILKWPLCRYEIKKRKLSPMQANKFVDDMLKNSKNESLCSQYDSSEAKMLRLLSCILGLSGNVKAHMKNSMDDFLFFRLYPWIFNWYSHRPIKEDSVLMITGMFVQLPDNFKMIRDAMTQKGYKCIILLKPQKHHSDLTYRYKLLKQSILFQKYFAQCRFCFLTENYRPVNANKPRPGTQVIQLWHACGAFKKVGYSTGDLSWGCSMDTLKKYNAYGTTTAAMVSSPKIIPDYAEAFNLPQTLIHPFGAPRTDIFFISDIVKSAPFKLRTLFPQIGNRKVLLYAPTFRGNSIKGSFYIKTLDYMLMKRILGNDYILITKLHPLTAQAAKLTPLELELYGDFVLDASSCLDINTALCAADILITDYSTVMCEYSLLERPMVFYAYDLQQYDRARSFYYNYRDFVPGPIVYDTVQLIEAVQTLSSEFDTSQVKKFRNDFMAGCDGHSTERIVNFVISQVK